MIQLTKENSPFKSKDELLQEFLRREFDDTSNDFMGDIDAWKIIEYCRHAGFWDLANKMEIDLQIDKLPR